MIEEALEPLVEFDIDTPELLSDPEGSQKQAHQLAEHLRSVSAPTGPATCNAGE